MWIRSSWPQPIHFRRLRAVHFEPLQTPLSYFTLLDVHVLVMNPEK